MSYNFKSLGEVELLNTMPETANVFVEVDGGIRRAPQVKVDVSEELVNKETLEEVPEGATVLAEVNGEIKRIHGDQVGGSKTIIFSVIETAETIDTSTYQTICNYSPAEVGELMLAGASCMLIVPYAAMMANASTLAAASATPTNVTMQALIGIQADDGSYQFMFFTMGSDVIIVYHADGTIENSLLSAEQES